MPAPVTRSRVLPLSPAVLAHVDAYMLSHLGEPVRLADLARLTHRSPSYFLNGYARATGETPMVALWRHRLVRAAWLLRHTALRVADVAAAVGATDHSYLSWRFRKVYGVSPVAYRRAAPPPLPDAGLQAVCIAWEDAAPEVREQVLRLLERS